MLEFKVWAARPSYKGFLRMDFISVFSLGICCSKLLKVTYYNVINVTETRSHFLGCVSIIYFCDTQGTTYVQTLEILMKPVNFYFSSSCV